MSLERLEERMVLSATGFMLDVPIGMPETGVITLPGEPQGAPGTASIAGTVLVGGATGLEGVELRLLDFDGNTLQETTTDASGAYRFEGLDAGLYGVQQKQPAGFNQGRSSVGDGGGVAVSDNLIIDIPLADGVSLSGYNFAESLATFFVVPPLTPSAFTPAAVQPIIGATVTDTVADEAPEQQVTQAVVTTEPAGYGGSSDTRLRGNRDESPSGIDALEGATRVEVIDLALGAADAEAEQTETPAPTQPPAAKPAATRDDNLADAPRPEPPAESVAVLTLP